jgi:hypothetical protein
MPRVTIFNESVTGVARDRDIANPAGMPISQWYSSPGCQSAFKFGSDSLLMQFRGCLAH